MADPYFSNVTIQLRVRDENKTNINSSFFIEHVCTKKNHLNYDCYTTDDEYFLDDRSFELTPNRGWTVSDNILILASTRFGTTDYTMEMRFLLISFNSSDESVLLEQYSIANGFYLSVKNTGVIEYKEVKSSTTLTGGLIELGEKYHIAITRKGTTLRLFLNGILISTTTSTVNHTWPDNPYYLSIGGRYGTRAAAKDATGYFDDLRITRNFCRYDSDFTPPIDDDFSSFDLKELSGSNLVTKKIQSPNFSIPEKYWHEGDTVSKNLNVKKEGYIKEGTKLYGDEEITGYAMLDGIPGPYKVTLLDRASKELIRITRSDSNGFYRFFDLPKYTNFLIICEDDEYKLVRKNAVARDFVKL